MTMNWSTQEHLHEKKGLLVMQNFVLKEQKLAINRNLYQKTWNWVLHGVIIATPL